MEKEKHLAPKALTHNQIHALIRTVQRHASRRDLAIIEVLRHTGVRVGDLAALRLTDVSISDRKGTLVVRWGKGGKYREIGLNADVRKALTDYLEIRPAVADNHLFIGQRGNGLTVRPIEDLVTKYARLAGIPEVTPPRAQTHLRQTPLGCWREPGHRGRADGAFTIAYNSCLYPTQRPDLMKAVDRLAETG